MAINAFNPTKNYGDGVKWTEAIMDAFVNGLDTWIANEVEAKCPDKTGTETVTGSWTFSAQPVFSAGVKTSSNTVVRSNGDIWTLPAVGAQNFVGDTATQTLTNKTIDSPTLSGTIVLPATDPPVANALVRRATAKAWAMITWTAGAPAINASFNVSSIVDTGVGDVQIVWNTDFSSATYAVMAVALDPGGTDPFVCSPVSLATGSCNIRVRNRSAGALTDPTSIYVVAFGDQ